MDFDEYEDDYPKIENQRFYGFKKFSLKNNYNDNAELREKVATDVFRAAGVPVSHTAFFTLFVDHGNGPEYFGLYTLVEEIDRSVLDTQFSSDDGNLYKPEDGSANFVEGTFNTQDFEKKTNEDVKDWSDIEALSAALHDDASTSDPATWRENLEAVFETSSMQASKQASKQAKYDNYSSLISPHSTSVLPGFSFPDNSDDFNTAIDALKSHATSRATAVENYLNHQ